MALTPIQEHVDLIAKHEQEFLARRSRAERLSDEAARFVGSFRFVLAHVAVFVVWIAWNGLPHVHHFDPHPYSLLSTLVGLEAILLASIILMRQARLGRRSDERDHLTLQILLLVEKEATALLNMERQIAQQIGLERAANAPEIKELSQHTSIEDVAQTIKESMTDEKMAEPAPPRPDEGDPFEELFDRG